jgi:glycosyltransferase involved in cell wall biosynthesis
MQAGLVSVMMPAYNAEAYIGEAIRSVVGQSYAKWELLVVDDGSTDATAAVAAEFNDPRIRLLTKENGEWRRVVGPQHGARSRPRRIHRVPRRR